MLRMDEFLSLFKQHLWTLANPSDAMECSINFEQHRKQWPGTLQIMVVTCSQERLAIPPVLDVNQDVDNSDEEEGQARSHHHVRDGPVVRIK